jgi:type VI secretion system protein VasD
MTDRRSLLAGSGALALLTLAGCGPEGPGSVTIAATGSAGMNPGPDGADRPVTLTVLQLRGTGAFDGADFFALQNPSAALGGDLVKADQIALAPGGTASKVIGLDPSTTAVGIVGGFRDPGGKVFRVKVGVSPTANVGLMVGVSGSGLTLRPV